MGKYFKKAGLLSFFFIGILIVTGMLHANERDYPNRPISMIIPATAGGISDLISRVLAESLSQLLGQPVLPINKVGGGQLIGGNAVATSKPDGYTVGMQLLPSAIPEVYRYFQEPPYTSDDLIPVCRIANFVGILVVKSDAPWKNFKELVEFVKKNSNMKYGITARGGSPHILMLIIEKTQKIKFVDFPNPGDADVVTNILGGHIPVGMVAYPSGKAQVQAGNLKVLAVYAEKRYELLSEVPTTGELGSPPGHFPCIGLFVSKGTPDSIVQRLCEASRKISEMESFQQKLFNLGFQPFFENSQQYKESLNRYKKDIGDSLKGLGFVK